MKQTYYHVTTYSNWADIRSNGLRAGGDGKIWLWDNIGHALHYAEGWTNPEIKPCIVVVRSDAIAEPTWWGDAWTIAIPSHHVYDIIRPEDFRHYEQDLRLWREGMKTANNDFSDSVMICLKTPDDVNKILVDLDECTEDENELHLTLLYLGTIEEAGGDAAREKVLRGCYDMALNSGYRGLTGTINGWGNFVNPDSSVLIALWDIPGIAEFRTHLQRYIKSHGAPLREDNHGFTPHTTIAYGDDQFESLPKMPEFPESHFTSIWLVWGEEWIEVPLA